MSGTVSHDSETPAYGQQVITACAFIHRLEGDEHQVFMARRALTKQFLPGAWELPGGHIDFGEDMRDGLAREIREEFGVMGSLGDPFAAFTYRNDIKGSHSIEVVYFAQFLPGQHVKLNPEDHVAAGWFDEETAVANKGNDHDDEAVVIRKGFALLRGSAPNF